MERFVERWEQILQSDNELELNIGALNFTFYITLGHLQPQSTLSNYLCLLLCDVILTYDFPLKIMHVRVSVQVLLAQKPKRQCINVLCFRNGLPTQML